MSKKKQTKAARRRTAPAPMGEREKKELAAGLQSILVPALLQALPVALSSAQTPAADKAPAGDKASPAARPPEPVLSGVEPRTVSTAESYLAGIDLRMQDLVARLARLNDRIVSAGETASQKESPAPASYMEYLRWITERVDLAHNLMDCIEQNI